MTRSTKDDFQFESRLGSGTFGVVWRAIRKLDGKPYAIKEVDLRYMNKKVDCFAQQLQAPNKATSCHMWLVPGSEHWLAVQEQEECIKEVQILASLDCPYVIRYFDSFLKSVRPAGPLCPCCQDSLHFPQGCELGMHRPRWAMQPGAESSPREHLTVSLTCHPAGQAVHCDGVCLWRHAS